MFQIITVASATLILAVASLGTAAYSSDHDHAKQKGMTAAEASAGESMEKVHDHRKQKGVGMGAEVAGAEGDAMGKSHDHRQHKGLSMEAPITATPEGSDESVEVEEGMEAMRHHHQAQKGLADGEAIDVSEGLDRVHDHRDQKGTGDGTLMENMEDMKRTHDHAKQKGGE